MIDAVRFNDYHKQICAALRFDDEMGRRMRTFMMRCYSRGVSQVACLALLKQHADVIEFLRARAERDATPPEAA